MADPTFTPESQKTRWLKYGTNVVIACALVVAVAALLTYAAERTNRRVDTTAAGQYSLRPQTKNIIRDLKEPIRLVSLYSPPRADDYAARTGTASDADRRARQAALDERKLRADTVADLVQEYARSGANIKAETIDPLAEPTRVDQLVAELTDKYGGEVKKYRDFLTDAWPKQFDQIKQLSTAEAAAAAKLQVGADARDEGTANVALARETVLAFPMLIEQVNRQLKRPLEEKPPDYKGAADTISAFVDPFDARVGQIVSYFQANKDNAKLPEDVRRYVAESLPRYEALKKLTGGVVEQTKNLGELKLDTLRQSLSQRNSILVLGAGDIKVIPEDKVWRDDVDRPAMARGGDVAVKSKFAGEQQVTSAILSLSQKERPVVVFVRPGGAPVATPGIPGFQRGGPLSAVADRLRDYNFEVVEKDLSGQSAMQAQMQGMPPEPEATDEQMKRGIWVVLNLPAPQQNPMMGMTPPSPVGPKLAEHLKAGGSALVLNAPRADGLEAALKDWGVAVRTDKIVVHESAAADGPRSRDYIEEAKKVPYIFVLQDYGNHPLAAPLAALDSVFLPLLPVTTSEAAGVKATPLLPVPASPKSWAESDTETISSGARPTFDEKADTAGPVFGGAAAEKSDGTGGRLVVLGALQFATNELVSLPDEELLRRGVVVSRFPGNAELVQNSVFWLARQEPMIAISPAAMEVSRIGPIADGKLKALRVGLLLIALPGAVLLAGVMTYFARRD